MSRETDIKLLMDDWEEKHKNNGYKRFIRDGIVCEEKWDVTDWSAGPIPRPSTATCRSSSCRSNGRNCGSRWGWRLRPVTRTPLRSSSRTS